MPKTYLDINGTEIKNGDIIDIGQTVNGCNEFVVMITDESIEILYYCNMMKPRFYEYDKDELLRIDVNTGEGPEIIGNFYSMWYEIEEK